MKYDLQVHHHCKELSLALLTEMAVAEYLATRFSGSDVATQIAPVIHQRTEGNPLFMVNMVDHLVTRKVVVQQDGQWELTGEVAETDVPASLRAFIEQQIEQVIPEAQQMIEAGSVTGMEFSAAVVAAGIDMAVGKVETMCEGLARQARFLQRKGIEEWPDGTVAANYSFVHALYQQILAERVMPGRCVELHRRIGERLEAAYGAQAGDRAAELALHFEHGREYQRAVQYRWQAGENALRQHAHHEAIIHLTKALELRATMSLVRLRQQQATQGATRTTQHELRSSLIEAHQMLSTIYNWFIEGFDTKDLQETKALLDSLNQTTQH
jgi:predicted ATPase